MKNHISRYKIYSISIHDNVAFNPIFIYPRKIHFRALGSNLFMLFCKVEAKQIQHKISNYKDKVFVDREFHIDFYNQ